MGLLQRLLPTPPVTRGEVGVGMLGLLSSWMFLGGGTALMSASMGSLLTFDEGACFGASERVCQAANVGGGIAGLFTVAVAVVFARFIARGFGPPVLWWTLPVVVAGFAYVALVAAVAGTDTVEPLPFALTLVLGALALTLTVAVLVRGRAARTGWVRFDGLDARDAPLRDWEAVLLPALALAAGSGGAAFALHVARLLATDFA